MAPTVEAEITTPSSSSVTCASISHKTPAVSSRSQSGLFDVCLSSRDSASSCHSYCCSKDLTPSTKSGMPEASPTFKEALGKMRLERVQDPGHNNAKDKSVTLASPSSCPSSSSLLNKLKLAFKSSSSVSPLPSLNHSQNSSSKSSSSKKTGTTRRPASFGGADIIKPTTVRRASQSEKRVSWGDEHGSNHALFSVRLIKPRLSSGASHASQRQPGQSILRNTGIH